MKKKYESMDFIQEFWCRDVNNFEYWQNLRKFKF